MEQHTSNISELNRRNVLLEPRLGKRTNAFHKFCRRLARKLAAADTDAKPDVITSARLEIHNMVTGPASNLDLRSQFCSSVVVDFVAQGWTLKAGQKKISLLSPATRGVRPEDVKQRIRTGHLVERDAQLRECAVVDFIKTMEKRRLKHSDWVSIYSLMRDGRELAAKLKAVTEEGLEAKRDEMLAAAISPYVQLVEADAICSQTGLRLIDIWRYFRHTWVSTYKSLPGRSMMLLIRDSAVKNHPVIGIAALGNSMAQQTFRDEWIGWESETFVKALRERPTVKWCKWVHDSVGRLLDGIYKKDFLNDGVVRRQHLAKPTATAIRRLTEEAAKSAKLHHLDAAAAEHKRNTNGRSNGTMEWEKQAVTPLFRAKRAKTLALLLGIRRSLHEAGLVDETAADLKSVLEDSRGRHALRQLIRLVKAEHVGVDMMDIIICGAIAPYNAVLGGKLVCMLLISPEIVKAYRMRYSAQASIIASSMKGATVVRRPNLVLLATTSLYGVGSSQYNRVRVPLAEIGGIGETMLEYKELGKSKGYGSYHFSKISIEYLGTLLPRGDRGRKVNSIFGEGVNPLMRKLRDGLAYVGLPADDLLLHGNSRVVYGVPIAENFREVLLGIDTRPKYHLSLKKGKDHTHLLGAFWRKRWLSGRITRPGILEDVAKHSMSYPISHGARVQLPDEYEDETFVA